MAQRTLQNDTDEARDRGPADPEPSRPPAWDELVRRLGVPLERMAAEALGRVGQRPDPHRVEDLVQEVYCRLLARGRGFDPHRKRGPQVIAYLRRVVRSAAVDGVRALCAAKRRAAEPAGALAGEPADPAPDPEQRLLARDRRSRLLARDRKSVV